MIRSRPFRKRIAGESAWAIAGQTASALGTLAGFRLVTEVVPPAVYGTLALAIGLVALGGWLAVQPLMQAALRHYPDHARDGSVALLRRTTTETLRWPVIWLSGGLTIALTAWSGYMHKGLLLGPACGLLVIAEAVRTVEVGFLSARREQRTLALLVAAEAWSRPFLAVGAVSLLGANAEAVVGGYAVGTMLSLLGFYVLRRHRTAPSVVRPHSEQDFAVVRRRLRAYAMPLLLLPLVGWVGGQADRYIVGGIAGLGFAGLYAAMYGIASRPFLMIRDAVETALLPCVYGPSPRGGARGHGGGGSGGGTRQHAAPEEDGGALRPAVLEHLDHGAFRGKRVQLEWHEFHVGAFPVAMESRRPGCRMRAARVGPSH